MKTSAVLATILPTVAAVRPSGAYNCVITRQAPLFAERLRQAANDDRIVVDTLLEGLARLGRETGFEGQQQAMEDVVRHTDQLIDAIAEGSVVHAETVPLTVGDLAARVSATAASLIDVFQPAQATVRILRAQASELNALVDGEVGEGTRPHGHSEIAARLYDAADRAEGGSHDRRQAAFVAIGRYAAELTA